MLHTNIYSLLQW